MDKFKPGDMVIARNGKGAVYCINRIVEQDVAGHKYRFYDFDNGSVHIAKRARSGWHDIARADRGYKLVRD